MNAYVDNPDTSCTVTSNKQLPGLDCDQYGELIVEGGSEGKVYSGWKFTEDQTSGYMWVGLPVQYTLLRRSIPPGGYSISAFNIGDPKSYNLLWSPSYAGFYDFDLNAKGFGFGEPLHLFAKTASGTDQGYFRPLSAVTYFHGPIKFRDVQIPGKYADITLDEFKRPQMVFPFMSDSTDREAYLGPVDQMADGVKGFSKEDTLASWAGWQMVSNPYTSHVSICKFYNANKGRIKPSIYVVLRKASSIGQPQVKYRDSTFYRLVNTEMDCSPTIAGTPTPGTDWKQVALQPFSSFFFQVKPVPGATDEVEIPITISQEARLFLNASRTGINDKVERDTSSQSSSHSVVNGNFALSSPGLDKVQVSPKNDAFETDLNQQIVQVSLVGAKDKVYHAVRVAARRGVTRGYRNFADSRVFGPVNKEAPRVYITDSENDRFEARFVSSTSGEAVPVYASTLNGSPNMKLAFEIKPYVKGRSSTIPVYVYDKFKAETHQLRNGEVYNIDLPENSDKLAGRFFIYFGKRPHFEKTRVASGNMIITGAKGMFRVYIPRDKVDNPTGGKTLISVIGLDGSRIYRQQFDNGRATQKRINGVDCLGFDLRFSTNSSTYFNNLNKPVVVKSQSGVTYSRKIALK